MIANGVFSCATTAWFAHDHPVFMGGWFMLVNLFSASAHFGNGHPNLGYLRRFPLDRVKIALTWNVSAPSAIAKPS